MKDEVRRAAEILRAGRLVAFPTETVYGLGADASNPAAIALLYAVKRRPMEHPVIVHFAHAERAFAWTREVPEAARKLAARFWPGPLTLVLKRSALARDFITRGVDTIGVRVPSHPVARAMLDAFGGGVAGPSANRFGRVSPTTAAHVRADLGRDVELVLEGGSSEVGIESTIIDLSRDRPVLLRPGHVSRETLEQFLGEAVPEGDAQAPRHPGAEIAKLGAHAAVLAFSRPDERVDYWLRMPRDAEGYARRLYAALRELDGAGCEAILIEAPPQAPAWRAVRDRLQRATSQA